MTVPSSSSKTTYSGNGATTAFAFPYLFFANSDLVVTLVASDGSEDDLVLNTDYTVTGAGLEAGGTVTLGAAPAVGETLVIRRVIAETQTLDLVAGDNLPADSLERALDRIVMMVQQYAERISRTVNFPVGDPLLNVDLPPAGERANMFLAFDANGNPIAANGSSSEGLPVSVFGGSLVAADDAAAARVLLELGAAALLGIASAGGLEDDGSGNLRVKLDGSTLARGASGLKVADGGITTTQLAASAHKVRGHGYATDSTIQAIGTIPRDTSKPQNTEGTEIVTLTYTVQAADSVLCIDFAGCGTEQSNTANWLIAALFIGSGADAVAIGFDEIGGAASTLVATARGYYEYAPGATGSVTFRLRLGIDVGSGRANASGDGTSVTMGGLVHSWIRVTERAP